MRGRSLTNTAQYRIHLTRVHRKTSTVEIHGCAAYNHDARDANPRHENYQPKLEIVGDNLDSRDGFHTDCYDVISFYED